MITNILRYEATGVYDDGWTDVEAILPIKQEHCGKIIDLSVYVPPRPGEEGKILTIETGNYVQKIPLERGQTVVCHVPISLTPSPQVSLRTTPEPAGQDKRRLGVVIIKAEPVPLWR